MDRKDVNLDELYRVANISVEQLERSQPMWISKNEIAALRTTLADEKARTRPACRRCRRQAKAPAGLWGLDPSGVAMSDKNKEK